MLAEANTFLENNKMINIIFNYIFGYTFQSPFCKVALESKSEYIVENNTYHSVCY